MVVFENGINSHDFDSILFHLFHYIEQWGDAHGRTQLIPLGMCVSFPFFSFLSSPTLLFLFSKYNFRLVQSCGRIWWLESHELAVSRSACQMSSWEFL